MEQKNEQQPERIPKRVLYIGAAVLLCAVIYVFVGITSQEHAAVPAAAQTALPTQTPSTPVPTLIPLGKTLPVVLDELNALGITITEVYKEAGIYTAAAKDYAPVTLIFSFEYRFVTAFSMQFEPFAVQEDSLLEEALAKEDAVLRYEHLKLLLPALIDAVDLKARLDYAAKLKWVELAQSALTSGEAQSDKLEGCVFSAFPLTSGETLVSVSFS